MSAAEAVIIAPARRAGVTDPARDPAPDAVVGDRARDTVVFDVGGVLIDWDPRRLYRKLLPDDAAVEHFLATMCTPEWNHEQDRGRPTSEAVAALSAAHPEQAALVAAYYDRWEEMLGAADDGAVAILRELREANVRTFALTNFSMEKWPIACQRYEFLGWFDGVVVSGAERLAKPEPEIFRLLCERYGVDPARAMYIDDQQRNVDGAARVGFDAVLFRSADQLRSDLVTRGLVAA